MENEMQGIGEALRQSRLKSGKSQQWVADKVGVDVRTVSRAENGVPVQVINLQAMCDLLNVPLADSKAAEEKPAPSVLATTSTGGAGKVRQYLERWKVPLQEWISGQSSRAKVAYAFSLGSAVTFAATLLVVLPGPPPQHRFTSREVRDWVAVAAPHPMDLCFGKIARQMDDASDDFTEYAWEALKAEKQYASFVDYVKTNRFCVGAVANDPMLRSFSRMNSDNYSRKWTFEIPVNTRFMNTNLESNVPYVLEVSVIVSDGKLAISSWRQI